MTEATSLVIDVPVGTAPLPQAMRGTPEAPLMVGCRFLVMAGQYCPEDDDEAELWDELLGWENAKGAWPTYAEAVQAIQPYNTPGWWWQIIDLVTLRMVYSSDIAHARKH